MLVGIGHTHYWAEPPPPPGGGGMEREGTSTGSATTQTHRGKVFSWLVFVLYSIGRAWHV